MTQQMKIILFSLLGVILIGSGVFVFISKDRGEAPIKELSEEAKTFNGKLEALQVLNLEKAREVPRVLENGTADLKPLESYVSLKPGHCEQLSGADKQACDDKILYYEIFREEDVTRCNELSFFKNECLHRLADGNPEACLQIDSEKKKEACISDAAQVANKIEICDFIEEDHDSSECKDRFTAIGNGGTLLEDERGEIAVCNEVNELEYFNQCVLRSAGDCTELTSADRVEDCQSLRAMGVVFESGDATNCSLLPSDSYRRVCDIFYENGQVDQDTDGDGLVNSLELWFSTDPFVAEEKATALSKPSDPIPNIFGNDFSNAIDSDGDGLSDEQEIFEYKTDPNNADTDGDSFSDKEEIDNGFNPLR